MKTTLCAVILFVLCGSAYAGINTQPAVLDIFADSSLSGAMKQIQDSYSAYHTADLNFRFAPSSELAQMIREGSACDVFIPSGSEYLDGINLIGGSLIDLVQKDGTTYPAGVLASTRNEKPAMRFVSYLTNNEAGQAFRKEGFVQVQARMNKPQKSDGKNKIKQK